MTSFLAPKSNFCFFIRWVGAMHHGFEGKSIYWVLACLRVGCVFGKVPWACFFEGLSRTNHFWSRKHGTLVSSLKYTAKFPEEPFLNSTLKIIDAKAGVKKGFHKAILSDFMFPSPSRPSFSSKLYSATLTIEAMLGRSVFFGVWQVTLAEWCWSNPVASLEYAKSSWVKVEAPDPESHLHDLVTKRIPCRRSCVCTLPRLLNVILICR